jgi:hypothetical protein
MTNQNPYESPADADRHLTNRNRACHITLAIVLLDVAVSAYKGVRNLPAMLADPDAIPVVIGAVLVFWIVWIAIELVAVGLVRRGRAVGRWILVASFGLKGIAQIGAAASWLPLLFRTPSSALAGPCLLYYLVQAICYCGATCWLLFFASLPSRCTPQGSQFP